MPNTLSTALRVDRRCTRPPNPFPDDIFIPADVRHIPLDTCPQMSVRLRNVLAYKGFTVFGDLHGIKLSCLARLRNCGRKTIDELGEAIQRVQRSSATGYVPPPPYPKRRGRLPLSEPVPLAVPPACRDLDPCTLPMSVRAEKVLNTLGLKRLGDLHGLPLAHLLSVDDCGWATAREIQNLVGRAANGEFTVSASEMSIPGLASEIENMLLVQLPETPGKVLLLRFGGLGQPPATLEHIAKRFRITREAVRQIVLRSVARLSHRGGNRRKALFDQLAATCVENVLPLTPRLFQKWAAAVRPLRFAPEFYVRLIAAMRRDIPTWVPGPQPKPHDSEHLQTISGAIESLMEQAPNGCSLPQAFQALRSTPAHSNTPVGDFLLAIKNSTRVRVTFSKPDRPRLLLRRTAH